MRPVSIGRLMLPAVFLLLAASSTLLPVASTAGATGGSAAAVVATGEKGLVQCQALRGGLTLHVSECSLVTKTGGSGKYSTIGKTHGLVEWASGRTTTLSNTSINEAIGACPPHGPGYHDLYDFSGDFVNNWGHDAQGSFYTGWCLSPSGSYLEGPFEI